MQINEVYKLMAACLHRIPARYFPKPPRILLHESSEGLIEFTGASRAEWILGNGFPASMVRGLADGPRNVIHLAYDALLVETRDEVLNLLLHELGHCYYYKHGEFSPEYVDERRANAFALRWFPKIKKELEEL